MNFMPNGVRSSPLKIHLALPLCVCLYPIHLKLQLSYFKEVAKRLRQQLGDEDGQKLRSNAVYLFSMGGNDYMVLKTDPKLSVLTAAYKMTFMTMVVGNFTTVIKVGCSDSAIPSSLKGGRKFAFQKVGPIGCMLATQASSGIDGCLHDPSVLAKMHNIALSRLLRKLAYQHAGFSHALFDHYTSVTLRTLCSSKFGKSPSTLLKSSLPSSTACCGSGPYNGNFICGCGKNGTAKYNLCGHPSEFVWFDPGRPTESANRQLASLLWNGPARVVGPYNLKMFFNGSS
ncbi:GDSL esterase/lipase 1-like [Eucalyptus grandis]|uniref:GDSL esterase/lipase 1-like n=1 Tax=Eucalyptus grandis TaxID=71139 RepID=UPI00192E92B6|nr:GDSL esterase/lipase 1-like [Eucalyptus grandis]